MFKLNIVEKRKIGYTVSFILILLSIASLMIFGLRYGLDFTGGTLMEIGYSETRPNVELIKSTLQDASFNNIQVQLTNDLKFIVRFEAISEEQHQALLSKLIEATASESNMLTEIRFESIGPTIGKELKRKSLSAIIAVLIAIVIYLAYAFRKVTRPVASWKFGTVAIIALTHDVLIVIGIFSVLGYLFNIEVDSLFVTALLTLLGFSVHDTIVTLDRVRENLISHDNRDFDTNVNISINETIIRSINTSVSTLFALVAIYILGGDSTKIFSLALIIGIIIGTYSSLFIAAPLLVTAYRLKRRT